MKSLYIVVGNLTQNVSVVLLPMGKEPGQIVVAVFLGSKHRNLIYCLCCLFLSAAGKEGFQHGS